MDINTEFDDKYLKSHKGIYYIKCLKNDKVYIGSTTKSFYKRWNQHIKQLKLNTHCNKNLLSDWNRYKKENFEFGVIEEIDNTMGIIEIEYGYILSKNTIIPNGYNMAGYERLKDGIERHMNFIPEGCFGCDNMDTELYNCKEKGNFERNCEDFYVHKKQSIYDLFGYNDIDKVTEAFLHGENFNEDIIKEE